MTRRHIALRAAIRAGAAVAVLSSVACERHTETYRCEGGAVVTAKYSSGAVRLELPDTTVDLLQVHSPNGDRYSDDTYTLWPRGSGVLVQRGDLIIYRNCIGAS